MINLTIVAKVIGVLLTVLGAFMLMALPVALIYACDDVSAIIGASITTLICGGALWYATRFAPTRIKKREGFLIVALGWLSVAIFSALPYIYSGHFPNVISAFFESVSGLTTTGATVLSDIEVVPKGILLWRSLTQWIGGMGIIVLTVAMFPLLGIGGVELFVAEAPGPTSDKIHPRIKETAKRLWLIYVGLTVLLIFLLFIEGMALYDAVNHGLTTMATGGFSTKNASVAHFANPIIHYTIAGFMFVAGVNYTIIYFSLMGKWRRVWQSEEVKTYVLLVVLLVLLVTIGIVSSTGQGVELSLRQGLFQVVSVITTTGFVSADYTSWSPMLSLLFFGLLFVGGCAGSTSGGIKIIRHLVFFKNSILELKRLLHPKAVIRTKIDRHIVAPKVLMHILVFLLLYLMVFVVGSISMAIVLSDWDQPILTAVGAAATALGNVGPAIGDLGPMDNFSDVPIIGKWILVFLMILGRLELFTVLILLTPFFWRKN